MGRDLLQFSKNKIHKNTSVVTTTRQLIWWDKRLSTTLSWRDFYATLLLIDWLCNEVCCAEDNVLHHRRCDENRPCCGRCGAAENNCVVVVASWYWYGIALQTNCEGSDVYPADWIQSLRLNSVSTFMPSYLNSRWEFIDLLSYEYFY